MTIPFIEENDQTLARKTHLAELQKLVGNVYPNKFERAVTKDGASVFDNDQATISAIVNDKDIKQFVPPVGATEPPSQEQRDADNAELSKYRVEIAGRIATPPRVMGKAAFVHLSDGKNRLQIYVRKQDVRAISNDSYQIIEDGNAGWQLMNLLDHGDFIGVTGFLFVTKTGELSIHVETLQFLAKALLPMPDKVHGIADPEIQRRYRYADLIADSLKIKTPDEERDEHEHGKKELTTREVFETRARLISGMRNYLDARDFTEVETPMLTPRATGAAAKPFETHHNALDIKLYARIAPELYLKRLLVGGFERVYELNRNFRNEGLSQRHNPEFTMLEFYAAYWDAEKMMDFAEEMIKDAVQKATGDLAVKFERNAIDFSKFERLTMKEAVFKHINPPGAPTFFEDYTGETVDLPWLDDARNLRTTVIFSNKAKAAFGEPSGEYRLVAMSPEESKARHEKQINLARDLWQEAVNEVQSSQNNSAESPEQAARDLIFMFEGFVEQHLIQPTFITDFPKAVSPLSKASPKSAQIAERFELFINGMECANGFSELNAPVEQYERFLDQARERERGDDEAMVLDEDYIRALAYGMPPAAGIGIGVDRLTMLLTNRHSIRDVILFPHLRPERSKTEEDAQETAS